MRLKDKVAIVTGGSRGIGYATVDAFLREGAKVILCASRQETADKAVTTLKEKLGERQIIAEDLGFITEDVYELLRNTIYDSLTDAEKSYIESYMNRLLSTNIFNGNKKNEKINVTIMEIVI